MKPEDYDYVVKNNICLFTKGPLSQWWGGFQGQESRFTVDPCYIGYYITGDCDAMMDKTENLEFNCCEQWMMALKALLFDDFEVFCQIMETSQPAQQKELGRKIKNYNQPMWDENKYEIVLEGNYNKFRQNPELKDFLKSFHNQTIFAEASPWDKIWGIGLSADDPKALDINTWQGENILGRVIGDVRKMLDLK